MPIYEYLCSKCGKTFTLILTLAEWEEKKARCPECGSEEVEQQYQSFFAVTSKKS